MSSALAGPLTVRINDGTTDRVVTKHVRGLQFTKTAPGGFQGAQMTVNLPRATFTDLGPGDRIWIYDARTAKTMWEGFVDNPGATDGPAGQSFQITATGSSVLPSDQSAQLYYVDSDLTSWQKYAGSAVSAQATTADDPHATDPAAAAQGLLCQFNPGQPIPGGAVAQIGYAQLAAAGMELGAFTVTVEGGQTLAGYATDYVVSHGSGTAAQAGIGTGTLHTGTSTTTRWVGEPGHFTGGQTSLAFQIRRTPSGSAGDTTVADDDTWVFLSNVTVLGRRMDINGNLISGAAGLGPADTVLAHQVVADLVGRHLLPLIDTALVRIDEGTYEIDQLAYPDGARAGAVLDDLAEFEPAFTYEMLESTPRGYRFGYRRWPTTARYEISTRDGYQAPGGESDLCNRIVAFYTDAKGISRSVVVTTDSDQFPALSSLEQLGRTKDADPKTLAAGKGSRANAVQYGEETLALKADPPKAATATLKRRIVDLQTGLLVWPWEIETGYMVRVRETGDLLPLTETTWEHDARNLSMTLGFPVPSDDQILAQLSRAS